MSEVGDWLLSVIAALPVRGEPRLETAVATDRFEVPVRVVWTQWTDPSLRPELVPIREVLW